MIVIFSGQSNKKDTEIVGKNLWLTLDNTTVHNNAVSVVGAVMFLLAGLFPPLNIHSHETFKALDNLQTLTLNVHITKMYYDAYRCAIPFCNLLIGLDWLGMTKDWSGLWSFTQTGITRIFLFLEQTLNEFSCVRSKAYNAANAREQWNRCFTLHGTQWNSDHRWLLWLQVWLWHSWTHSMFHQINERLVVAQSMLISIYRNYSCMNFNKNVITSPDEFIVDWFG